MNIKVGEIVSIRHCSRAKLWEAVILEVKYDLLILKLHNDISELKYSIGDPVVLGFESNSLVYISSCNILGLDVDTNILKLKTDSIETLTNKRLFERFPVSFNANIKIGSSTATYSTIIKNLSF